MPRGYKGFRLTWRGPEVERRAVGKLNLAMEEIGQMVVVEAQRELYPGHGYLTGALHASLYYRVTRRNRQSVLAVGSPLPYAIWVHEGHHSFEGYHYLTIGASRVWPLVPHILARYDL